MSGAKVRGVVQSQSLALMRRDNIVGPTTMMLEHNTKCRNRSSGAESMRHCDLRGW